MTNVTTQDNPEQKPIPDEAPAVENDLSQQRDERCIPIAQKILQTLFEENAFLIDLPYIEQLVIKNMENLLPKEAGEVLSKATHGALKTVWDLVEVSMKHNLNIMYEKLLKQEKDSLRMQDVEKVLQDNQPQADKNSPETPEQ